MLLQVLVLLFLESHWYIWPTFDWLGVPNPLVCWACSLFTADSAVWSVASFWCISRSNNTQDPANYKNICQSDCTFTLITNLMSLMIHHHFYFHYWVSPYPDCGLPRTQCPGTEGSSPETAHTIGSSRFLLGQLLSAKNKQNWIQNGSILSTLQIKILSFTCRWFQK